MTPSHKAIQKLRAKIFSKYNAAQYGFIMESEKIDWPRLRDHYWGGLSYRIADAVKKQIDVRHFKDSQFHVILHSDIHFGSDPLIVPGDPAVCDFKDLDQQIYSLLYPELPWL